MAPKGVAAAALPEGLKPLAEELARLPTEQREQVIAAARANANDARPKLRAVPAERLRSAFGVVRLGGNAVDDVNSLWRDNGDIEFLGPNFERLFGVVVDIVEETGGRLGANDALLVALQREGTIESARCDDRHAQGR